MYIRFKRKYTDNWHHWYAWRPTLFYSKDEGCYVIAWFTYVLRKERKVVGTDEPRTTRHWEYETL